MNKKNMSIVGAGLLLITITVIMFSLSNQKKSVKETIKLEDYPDESLATVYVAGGCFWCVEADMEKLDGVVSAISGYAGGRQPNPTYRDHGDHREAVKVVYDSSVVSFTKVVTHFLTHHDAADPDGSFYDRGHAYTSAIHYQNDEEKEIVESIISRLDGVKIFNNPIATAIEPFIDFTDAEDYHQDYYKNNPIRYKGYRIASGRESFVKETVERYNSQNVDISIDETEEISNNNQWSDYIKPPQEEIKSQLSDIQYRVTQHEGTERPFSDGNHDDEKRAGIFVDVLSGEPLYSSRDKFDSGTGWPSFTQPISSEFIVEKTDYKLVWPRTEIRSRYADNHIGHVFSDGPKDRGGLRYCMNGAAMRFVTLEDMEQKGYADYTQYVQ